MKHSARKQRKRIKRQSQRAAVQTAPVAKTTPFKRMIVRLADFFRESHFVRGASTLTLFPQLPEVDCSVHAQREELAQTWREVYDCLRDSYYQESARVRDYERKK